MSDRPLRVGIQGPIPPSTCLRNNLRCFNAAWTGHQVRGTSMPVYDQLPCIRARDFPERPSCPSQKAPGPKARWGH
eukprot:2079889-Amphidinium_carterae.1